MKAKQLAKRLRTRSDDFHRMALTFDSGDKTVAERARLIGDVLQEVADVVSPPKPTKKAKKIDKTIDKTISLIDAKAIAR